MICPNCHTSNNDNSKFCIKCGNNLSVIGSTVSQSISENVEAPQQVVQNNEPTSIVQNTLLNQQPIIQDFNANTSQTVVSNVSNVNSTSLNYLMYLLLVLVKPFKCFKEEEEKLSNTKTSLILSGIVAGIMMLINLISTMISTIFAKKMDYSTFQYKTTLEFSNLKELDYLSLIGKNLLIYAAVILAIALVYYLASLVAKKQVSFIKFLSISATSVVPFVIIGMVVSPILGKIWSPLAIILMIIGVVYSITIFIFLIKEEIKFEKQDLGIYFHLICMSILGTAGYYTFIKILTSKITDQLGDIMDLFG